MFSSDSSPRHYCYPGERVPQSGAYLVLHHLRHRPEHTVVAIEGEVFPHCRVCRDQVRFKLQFDAEYVLNDPDFTSPGLRRLA